MLELFVHLQVLTLTVVSRAGTSAMASRHRPWHRSPRPYAKPRSRRTRLAEPGPREPEQAEAGQVDAGQTTAEYALVLLAAAAIALLVIAWATKTNRIGKLFDFVLDQVIGKVT